LTPNRDPEFKFFRIFLECAGAVLSAHENA
jgi:hypothetical protein